MTTTIQITDDIANTLKSLKGQYHVKTYSELLKVVLAKARRPEKSMWGAGGKMSMKEVLKDLRDETDRY